VYEKHKLEALEKPRGTRKLENLGIPQDQLLQGQLLLFAKARAALTNSTESTNITANTNVNSHNNTYKTHINQYQQQQHPSTRQPQHPLSLSSPSISPPHQTSPLLPLSASTSSLINTTPPFPPTAPISTTGGLFKDNISSKKRTREEEEEEEGVEEDEEDEEGDEEEEREGSEDEAEMCQ